MTSKTWSKKKTMTLSAHSIIGTECNLKFVMHEETDGVDPNYSTGGSITAGLNFAGESE